MDDQSLGRPGIAQVLLQSIEKERAAREQREAKERRDQRREFFIEFQSVAFDKAAAYVGLLLSAGYIGFFAIWGWVQPYLARWETLTTALLLGFSLFAFILWQVYAMALIGRQQMLLANVISAPEADFDKVVAEHKQKGNGAAQPTIPEMADCLLCIDDSWRRRWRPAVDRLCQAFYRRISDDELELGDDLFQYREQLRR